MGGLETELQANQIKSLRLSYNLNNIQKENSSPQSVWFWHLICHPTFKSECNRQQTLLSQLMFMLTNKKTNFSQGKILIWFVPFVSNFPMRKRHQINEVFICFKDEVLEIWLSYSSSFISKKKDNGNKKYSFPSSLSLISVLFFLHFLICFWP